MILQLILEHSLTPIRYSKVVGITISNKKGLHIIGNGYSDTVPLEKIKSVMVVENESANN